MRYYTAHRRRLPQLSRFLDWILLGWLSYAIQIEYLLNFFSVFLIGLLIFDFYTLFLAAVRQSNGHNHREHLRRHRLFPWTLDASFRRARCFTSRLRQIRKRRSLIAQLSLCQIVKSVMTGPFALRQILESHIIIRNLKDVIGLCNFLLIFHVDNYWSKL